jgi:hypothetical protein
MLARLPVQTIEIVGRNVTADKKPRGGQRAGPQNHRDRIPV